MPNTDKQLPEGFIITIDGTAASGKGSTASNLAKHLGLIHIDSGAFYRAVAHLALERKIATEEEEKIVELLSKITPELLNDDKIRSEEVSSHVPHVAKIVPLRAAMKVRQRELAYSHKAGAVIEGRDIGTKVFPDAPLKFYITASQEERARRRLKQINDRGEEGELEKILHSIVKRDEEDMNRSVDPLVPAEDAIHIDNTNLSKEEVQKTILKHLETHFK